MSRMLLMAVAVWFGLASGTAQAKLPESMDQLKELHAEMGKTPEGTVKLWLDACFVYMDEATRDLGREMLQYLTVPFKDDAEWDKRPSQKYFADRLKDPGKHFIFQSYAKGTSPQNGYAMDRNDWELNHVRNNQREGDARGIQCYIKSSGADSPRPVYLIQSKKTSLWYVNVYANVYLDCRPPVDPNAEF